MAEQVDYAPILADLERRRDEISRAIATIRAVAGMPPEEMATTAAPHPAGTNGTSGFRRDQFFGMKSPEAIRAYLTAVKQPQTAAKIASELLAHGFHTTSRSPANSMRTSLIRMAEQGEVVQVKGKEWGLIEWYPGLRGKRGRRDDEGGQNTTIPTITKASPPAYRAFIARKMTEGVPMAEAARAWRELQDKVAMK